MPRHGTRPVICLRSSSILLLRVIVVATSALQHLHNFPSVSTPRGDSRTSSSIHTPTVLPSHASLFWNTQHTAPENCETQPRIAKPGGLWASLAFTESKVLIREFALESRGRVRERAGPAQCRSIRRRVFCCARRTRLLRPQESCGECLEQCQLVRLWTPFFVKSQAAGIERITWISTDGPHQTYHLDTATSTSASKAC